MKSNSLRFRCKVLSDEKLFWNPELCKENEEDTGEAKYSSDIGFCDGGKDSPWPVDLIVLALRLS